MIKDIQSTGKRIGLSGADLADEIDQKQAQYSKEGILLALAEETWVTIFDVGGMRLDAMPKEIATKFQYDLQWKQSELINALCHATGEDNQDAGFWIDRIKKSSKKEFHQIVGICAQDYDMEDAAIWETPPKQLELRIRRHRVLVDMNAPKHFPVGRVRSILDGIDQVFKDADLQKNQQLGRVMMVTELNDPIHCDIFSTTGRDGIQWWISQGSSRYWDAGDIDQILRVIFPDFHGNQFQWSDYLNNITLDQLDKFIKVFYMGLWSTNESLKAHILAGTLPFGTRGCIPEPLVTAA